MKPKIYSKDFKYTRAVETDIRKTFARVKKQMTKTTTAEVKDVGRVVQPVARKTG